MKNLKDIAKAAAVSSITVSRVINSPEKVKPETRERIEKIMRSMDYTPNMAAKNLVSKRTGIIDVYVPENIDLNTPFIMYFIAGISEGLSEDLYSFLIKRSWKRDHRCDGYIVTGLLTEEIYDFYSHAQARNLPVALFGHTDIEEIDCFDVDNVLGAVLAVDHLIQMGHRNIAFINTDENKDYAADRFQGYKNALSEAGMGFNPALAIRAKNTIQGGNLGMKTLLRFGGFTAVFCTTDIMAIGVINALHEAGLRVPEDLSVVGFDGLGIHRLTEPPITTIRQPVFEIGKKLARRLVGRIGGSQERMTGFLPPELLPGKSVNSVL
ncbi:putative HTH-type transcriptional regulator DegA [Hollandina sp. SP2]